MPRYKRTSVTAKVGLNFVRAVVEGAGSLFHKIEQENDLGIDALLEFVRDERPLNQLLATQVKSGASYYDQKHDECLLPVASHRDYWLKYPVPVVGIVYVPSQQKAYWVDIKHYLKKHPAASIIRFPRTEANRFDGDQFLAVFMPLALQETPVLPFSDALALFRSSNPDERQLGLVVLFRRYPNQTDAWDAFVDLLVTAPTGSIPPGLIYYLAHIPWHGDIFYRGETITAATREHVHKLLSTFGRPEVLKLLHFIDQENMISRGTLGQSVEAIITSLPEPTPFLKAIAEDSSIPLFRRECAALIYAIHNRVESLPLLARLAASGSSYAQELLEHVKEYGSVNPYM
jgi:hypothetical protein